MELVDLLLFYQTKVICEVLSGLEVRFSKYIGLTTQNEYNIQCAQSVSLYSTVEHSEFHTFNIDLVAKRFSSRV